MDGSSIPERDLHAGRVLRGAHHKHMDNSMKCAFTALNDNKTRYDYEFEYTGIDWVMPRLMAIKFPGMYREQGDKWMKQFREFAERQ